MKNNSVSLHRIVKASPEKVFRAFADPIANSTWFPPYGFICTVQQMDFQIGGKFRMTFINFSTGNEQSCGGEYLEIEPNALIKYVDRFDDPNLPEEITTTIRLSEFSGGTSREVQQVVSPEAILADMGYMRL